MYWRFDHEEPGLLGPLAIDQASQIKRALSESRSPPHKFDNSSRRERLALPTLLEVGFEDTNHPDHQGGEGLKKQFSDRDENLRSWLLSLLFQLGSLVVL